MLRGLTVGDAVRWSDKTWEVEAIRADAIRLYPEEADGPTWVSVKAWHRGDLTRIGDPSPQRLRLPDVDDSTIKFALWVQGHLNEVEFGVRDPNNPEAVPRHGYGPGTTKRQRRERKCAELKAADAQWQPAPRTLERYGPFVNNLFVLGRVRNSEKSVCPQAGPEVHEAVQKVLSDLTDGATVSARTLMQFVEVELALCYPERDIRIPSESTMRRLLKFYDPEALHQASAVRRRQQAKRPDRASHPVQPMFPGQYVEVDSTPMNTMALDADGVEVRLKFTAAIDIFTRSLLAFDVVPDGTRGIDHMDLILRMLRPWHCRPDTPAALRLGASSALPAEAIASTDPDFLDALAVPFIWPQSITNDKGSDYISPTVVNACEQLGITVRQAPPGTPTGKPHVESLMDSMDELLLQKLPGYLGKDATKRATVAATNRLGLLTIPELRAVIEEFWVVVWQNRPHPGLRDMGRRKRVYSPNQMYTEFFNFMGGLPVPLDEDTYISLLPTYERTIQHDHFQIDWDEYYDDRLIALRKTLSPKGNKLWDVHYDPQDPTRVWVEDPDTHQFIEAKSREWEKVAPLFRAVDDALRELDPADDRLAHDWAVKRRLIYEQTFLSRQAAKKAAEKASRKTSTGARTKRRNDVVDARRAEDAIPRPQRTDPDFEPRPSTPRKNKFRVLN